MEVGFDDRYRRSAGSESYTLTCAGPRRFLRRTYCRTKLALRMRHLPRVSFSVCTNSVRAMSACSFDAVIFCALGCRTTYDKILGRDTVYTRLRRDCT